MKLFFLILITISSIMILYNSPELDPVNADINMVPMGAIFFYLNNTYRNENYSLTQFVSDTDFTGYYNIMVQVTVWFDDRGSDPNHNMLIINLWNKSSPIEEKTTADYFDSRFKYSYSKPAQDNSDFYVQVRIPDNDTVVGTIEGWIYFSVDDMGTTEQPDDFTMPEPFDSSFIPSKTTITKTSSVEQSNVGYYGIFTLFSLFTIIIKIKRKRA